MDREKISKKLIFWYSILWVLLFVALWEAYVIFFPDTTSTKSKWIGLFAGAIFLLLSFAKNLELSYFNYGNKLISSISSYFKKGLNVFYKSSVKYILFCAFVVGIILYNYLKYKFIICYATGVFCALFLIFGLNSLCSEANAKITYAINNNSKSIFRLLFSSGVLVGGFSIGLSISLIVILFHIFKDYQIINGFCLGLCVVVFLNTTICAISKKAALCANHAFLDTEDELIKHDKRNPLLLVLGVSNANFSINSVALEMTNAFIAIMVASMTAGGYCYNLMGAFLPIVVAGSGIFSCVLVILLKKIRSSQNPTKTMFLQSFMSCVLMGLISSYVIKTWFPQDLKILYPILIGSFGGLILTFLNFRQIEYRNKLAKALSNSASNGVFSLFFKLFCESSNGAFLPCLIFALIIISSFLTGYGVDAPAFGIFSITLSVLAFVSCVGVILSFSIFALGTNSANAINDTFEDELTKNHNINLFSQNVHNLMVLGKNFINSITILGAIGILIGYTILVEIDEVDILNPYVLGALLVGVSVPFAFCSWIVKAANKSTLRLVFEAKKHFKHFPQILSFQMRPDYENFAKILANSSSFHSLTIFALLVVLFSLIAKNLMQEALMGFVLSVILSSLGLVFLLNNGQNLIFAAKKYFSYEYENAKYTNEYGMISQGEKLLRILGDLLIPSINSLLIFLSILALAVAPMYLNCKC